MQRAGFLRTLALGIAVALPAGAVHCALMPAPAAWAPPAAGGEDDADGHCCGESGATQAPHETHDTADACPCLQLTSALVPQPLKIFAGSALHPVPVGCAAVLTPAPWPAEIRVTPRAAGATAPLRPVTLVPAVGSRAPPFIISA